MRFPRHIVTTRNQLGLNGDVDVVAECRRCRRWDSVSYNSANATDDDGCTVWNVIEDAHRRALELLNSVPCEIPDDLWEEMVREAEEYESRPPQLRRRLRRGRGA